MRKSIRIALVLCMLAAVIAPVAAQSIVEVPASEPAVITEYTIRFDLNTTPFDTTDDELFEYEVSGYDEYWQPITEMRKSVLTVPYSDNAYIASSIIPPAREGYVFAGWQTRPVVTEDDLVNGVSPYLWLFGTQSSYGDESVVMPISEMESLDGNGVGTLYARWVEVKDIATEEELFAIADDLYGAYRLVADIQLTEEWTPVGLYFSNYELYAPEWWTYAFRGSFDGNGHSISGLYIAGSSVDVSAYREEGAVWHNDGNRADGCAAMFGAISSASISNLTLESPYVDVTGDNASRGDYIYAAPLAAFDMNSSILNVTVINPSVVVECYDDGLSHLASVFASISGMIAGGWNDTLTYCNAVGGAVSIYSDTTRSHGGEFYVGGLVGECYSTMVACYSSAEICTTVNDLCEGTEDAELKVLTGGLSGASTVTMYSSSDSIITVAVSKPVGASSVNVGALSGAQRYLTSSNNALKADITTDCKLDPEKGSLNVGAACGQIDVFYALQILMYTPVATAGVSDSTADVTVNGEKTDVMIARVPELDGMPLGWINKGDYQIVEGYVAPSNIEAVAAKYGSYLPVEYLQDGIIWIQY